MKKWVILFGCFCFLSVPSGAHAVGMEVAVAGWNPSPSGDLGYNSKSASENLDLEDDLDYDGKFQFTGRMKFDMPMFIPNIYVMVTAMDFDGTGSKDGDFTFGDLDFEGNTEFTSETQLTHYDVALYYGLPFVKTATAGLFNVDLGVNLRLMDLKAEIEQKGNSESESLFLPIPMAYIAAQFQPTERLALEAELRGVAYEGNSYFSAIGRLKVNLFGPLFAATGYRYESVDFEKDELDLDARFTGPFFELGGKF